MKTLILKTDNDNSLKVLLKLGKRDSRQTKTNVSRISFFEV